MITSEIKEASDFAGVSMNQTKWLMVILPTTDPWFAAFYCVADSLAVSVKYDRHGWNMRYAASRLESFKEKIEEIRSGDKK